MAYPYQSYQNPYQQGYYPVYQQPQYQQPQIQQPVQPQQTYSPVINQSGIIWISGESEAAMYPIAPNNAVALWAKDGKTIYLKSADATGKPTMHVYDLVERSQSASEPSEKEDNKSDEYAKKSDLAAVVGVVKEFDELLGSIKSDVDAMKGDLWGIAGQKKKTTIKKTVSDDAEE